MFSWFGGRAPPQCFAKRSALAQLTWIGLRTAQCRKPGIKDSHAIQEFPLITSRYAGASGQPCLYGRRETSRSWSTAMVAPDWSVEFQPRSALGTRSGTRHETKPLSLMKQAFVRHLQSASARKAAAWAISLARSIYRSTSRLERGLLGTLIGLATGHLGTDPGLRSSEPILPAHETALLSIGRCTCFSRYKGK